MEEKDISLIHELANEDDQISNLVDEHYKEYDEILSHVLFGDITRLIKSWGGKYIYHEEDKYKSKIKKILNILEHELEEENPQTDNLIHVSFIENLSDANSEIIDFMKSYMGPKLKEKCKYYEL